MLANADILHTTLDTLDMTGIQTYNFVGCGVGKTVTGIQIGKKTFFNDGYKLFYGTGDETGAHSQCYGWHCYGYLLCRRTSTPSFLLSHHYALRLHSF